MPSTYHCGSAARKDFLYRCGVCDRISMLVRVMYELLEDAEVDPVDVTPLSFCLETPVGILTECVHLP